MIHISLAKTENMYMWKWRVMCCFACFPVGSRQVKTVFHVSFWPQTARNTVFHVSLCCRRRETPCFMFHDLGRETASGDDRAQNAQPGALIP